MIRVHTIRWKNLLSTGNSFTEIKIEHGLTLITGENGAGKTTFLDALCFGLYNKAYRNINKPQLINSINAGNLIVEVEFEVDNNDFLIRRGMKPHIFEIYKNDKLIDQTASVKDYQDMLEKQILKMSYKTFCQVVVLGSTSFIPFMQLPPHPRRNIVENLLDLEIFGIMNNLLSRKQSSLNGEIKNNEFDLSLAQEKLVLHEKQAKRQKIDIEGEIAKKKKQVQNWNHELSEYEQSIKVNIEGRDNLKPWVEHREKIDSNRKKIESYIHEIQSKQKACQKEIDFLNDHNVCPTCDQDIEFGFKNEKLSDLNERMRKLVKAKKSLDKKMVSVEDKDAKIKEFEKQISSLNIEISADQASIKAIRSNIEELTREISDIAKKSQEEKELRDTKEIEEEIRTLSSSKKELLDEKEIISVASTLLNDTGIKAQIIKQYVPIINKLINKYLSIMDFFVEFELDETFSETIKSRHRDEFSYDSFSEGEKTRINLAILFTWRTIAKLRNSASTNILIFDEVLDGSTDQNGIEAFFNIIGEDEDETSVFVISHTQDIHESKFNRVMRFEKVKDFSVIKD